MAATIWSKSAAHTLRYFRRGHERAPDRFWLVPDNTPPGRVRDLVRNGLIEQGAPPHLDLYRVTPAGLAIDI